MQMRNCKDFGFKDQLTRSGLSIPSNIAEGLERQSDSDTLRFLDYARASSAELQTQIYIGMKVGFIDKKSGLEWIKECEAMSKMLNAFMTTIKKGLTNQCLTN